MRQGISTRYAGPTNFKGSRIIATARKASSLGKAMRLEKPYGFGNTEEEHTEAAKLLATKLGWAGTWVGGGTPSEDGFQYVNIGHSTVSARFNTNAEEGRAWGELREGRDCFYVPQVKQ